MKDADVPREKTYLTMHPSRWKYARWYYSAVFFMLVGFIILLYTPGLYFFGIGMFAGGLLLLTVGDVARFTKTYYITSLRIIEKTGILNTDENSVNWDRIANYTVIQSATDRLLNLGTVEFDAMTGEKDKEDKIVLSELPNLSKVKEMLDGLATEKEAPV